MGNTHNFNFIDLFSGAGGISCGLEQLGMNCLLGLDYDKYAIETFKANHPDSASFCGDIRQLKKKDFEKLIKNQKVDLVVGGPPCQGFSTVGTGNPDDERNHLFHHFLRLVKYCQPTYLVIENVTGLLAKKNEDTLHAILHRISSLGYYIDFNVLSAEQYGVPEKRRRTIIMGSKIHPGISLPKPTRKKPRTVGQALANLKAKGGKVHNHDIETATPKNKIDQQRLNHIPEGRGIRYEKDELELLPKRLRMGVNWKEMREGRFRQTKYYRLNRELPSPTIMTHRGNYYHPVENRFLTAREAAKLQSFPNNFVFKGPLSAQWRQIGNAVPPQLAKEIGKQILRLNEEKAARKSKAASNIKSEKRKQIKQLKDQLESKRGKAFHYR
jgi:DNA (cytosine-5)-methyltransferase 1